MQLIIKILFLNLILLIGFSEVKSQSVCDFKFKSTSILDNTLRKAKIPKENRLKPSDSLSIYFMEGFSDSIVVYVDGVQIYTGEGFENYSTGLTGMNFRVHKNDILGKVIEVFSINKKHRSTVVITNSEVRVLLFRILHEEGWVCDLRNYRVRLQ